MKVKILGNLETLGNLGIHLIYSIQQTFGLIFIEVFFKIEVRLKPEGQKKEKTEGGRRKLSGEDKRRRGDERKQKERQGEKKEEEKRSWKEDENKLIRKEEEKKKKMKDVQETI